MRLLRRHLLRSVSGPFLFSLGAMTGMLMVNQLAKRFGELVGKDLPWTVIAEVLGLSLPFIVALTLPMAVLVAVLYGFSDMASENEITAMRANGVSLLHMVRPVLWAGMVLTVVNFVFVDQVLPRTNTRLRNLQTDIARKKPTFQLHEQAINDMPPSQYFLRASRILPGSGRLWDVTIYDLGPPDSRRVIYADSGYMAFEADRTDLGIRLFSGSVHEYKIAEPGQVQITHFEVNTIRVRDVENMLHRNLTTFEKGDREMSTCEMMDEVSRSRRVMERAAKTRTDLAVQDLRGLMRLVQSPRPYLRIESPGRHCGRWRVVEDFFGRLLLPEAVKAQASGAQSRAAAPGSPPMVVVPPGASAAGSALGAAPPAISSSVTDVVSAREEEAQARRNVNAFSVEIHKKYTISVACFNFVLIGVALALRFPRGGMGLVIGGGLLIFALFYVSLTAGESLADRGIVTPAVAMWFPNLVVLIAGLLGLLMVNREFGSTRGGDLADLAYVLFGWLPRRRRREA